MILLRQPSDQLCVMNTLKGDKYFPNYVSCGDEKSKCRFSVGDALICVPYRHPWFFYHTFEQARCLLLDCSQILESSRKNGTAKKFQSDRRYPKPKPQDSTRKCWVPFMPLNPNILLIGWISVVKIELDGTTNDFLTKLWSMEVPAACQGKGGQNS